MSPRRATLFVLAVLFAGAVLFVGFAEPEAGMDWSPARTLHFSLDEATSPTSTLIRSGDMLRLEGADINGASIVLNQGPAFDAADFDHVVFRIESLSSVAKPLFVWRREGQLHFLPLYDTWLQTAVVPLSNADGWEGRIDAFGIAVLPTDYLHARAITAPGFALRSLRLESTSLRGALLSLTARWSAYRPWNGRSNHTGGFELSAQAGPSRQAFVAAWLALALALSFLFGGRASHSFVWPLCVLAAALLALQQLAQLTERAQVVLAARALVKEQPDIPLAAQPQIGAAAVALSEQLALLSTRPRVIVHGDSLFLREYPTYLLRAHDAATLASPALLPAPEAMPDAILVLVGNGGWSWNPEAGELEFASQRWRASLFFDGGVLSAYRLGGAPAR